MDIHDIIQKVHAATYKDTVKAIEALTCEEFDYLADEFKENPGPHFSDNILVAMSYLTQEWKPDPGYEAGYAYAAGYPD